MIELCWLSLCLTALKNNVSLMGRLLNLDYSSRNELHSSVKEVYAIIIMVLFNGSKRNFIIEKYLLAWNQVFR